MELIEKIQKLLKECEIETGENSRSYVFYESELKSLLNIIAEDMYVFYESELKSLLNIIAEDMSVGLYSEKLIDSCEFESEKGQMDGHNLLADKINKKLNQLQDI